MIFPKPLSIPRHTPVGPRAATRRDATLGSVVVNGYHKLGVGWDWRVLNHCPPFRRRASNSHTTPQHKTAAQTPTLKAVSNPNSVTFCLQFPSKPTRPRQRVQTRPTPRREVRRCLRRGALLGHHEYFAGEPSGSMHIVAAPPFVPVSPGCHTTCRSACVAAAGRPRGGPAVTPPPSAS